MMKIKTAEIKVNHGVMIRQKLDEDRVQEFMDIFSQLPPIKVFEIDKKLLLSDGFHRLAAAERLGLSEIEAEVKKGSRKDAIIEAISINARHGKPLNQEEKAEAIKRLSRLSPDMTNKEVGLLVGYSENHVYNILRAAKVRSSLGRPTFLSDTHLREVATLDKELWPDFVTSAEDRGWTRDETSLASQEIRDEKTTAERKRALLSGAADPTIQKEGKPAFLKETVQRHVAEEAKNDYLSFLESALYQLVQLRRFTPKEIVEGLEVQRLSSLVRELPKDINFLNDIIKLGCERLEILREVENESRGFNNS